MRVESLPSNHRRLCSIRISHCPRWTRWRFWLHRVLVQPGHLVTQRLKFGFGFGFRRVAGCFHPGGERINVAIDLGQLRLLFGHEFRLLRISVFLLRLRQFFRGLGRIFGLCFNFVRRCLDAYFRGGFFRRWFAAADVTQ